MLVCSSKESDVRFNTTKSHRRKAAIKVGLFQTIEPNDARLPLFLLVRIDVPSKYLGAKTRPCIFRY
jgi:hypothetical protein